MTPDAPPPCEVCLGPPICHVHEDAATCAFAPAVHHAYKRTFPAPRPAEPTAAPGVLG